MYRACPVRRSPQVASWQASSQPEGTHAAKSISPLRALVARDAAVAAVAPLAGLAAARCRMRINHAAANAVCRALDMGSTLALGLALGVTELRSR